jgi:hypothetical protein
LILQVAISAEVRSFENRRNYISGFGGFAVYDNIVEVFGDHVGISGTFHADVERLMPNAQRLMPNAQRPTPNA